MDFHVVQKHFGKLKCFACQAAFAPEGVELVRQEEDFWVVRVKCMACGQKAGVAIVGVEYDGATPPDPEKSMGTARPPTPEQSKQRTTFRDETFSSIRERANFKKLEKITMNDVLDAAKFIKEMDTTWNKYIPKKFRP